MADFIQHNAASIINEVLHSSNLKNKFKNVEAEDKDILVYKINKPHLPQGSSY